MFCHHHHINQLTALLRDHGIADFVVCPGSRNGAIVHNLHALEQTGEAHLFPVTDERCAAFTALGISLRTGRPTAVCVTSGSALLNTLPAVAEAYYQRVPLLVVSADRPQHLVGQLDGQTLPQPGALLPYCRTWQLTESEKPEERHHNNRQINEALLSLWHGGGKPAHINVPLTPPLFRFDLEQLPAERVIGESRQPAESPIPPHIMQYIGDCDLPLLVLGQLRESYASIVEQIEEKSSMLVLPELIANVPGSKRLVALEQEPLPQAEIAAVHIGGNLIGKHLKETLRDREGLAVVRIEESDDCIDTFRHLAHIVRTRPEAALRQLADELPPNPLVTATRQRLDAVPEVFGDHCDTFDEQGVMRAVAEAVEGHPGIASLHFANSTTIRQAARCFEAVSGVPVCCNRGVNGIEGSVSTAAGFALKDAADEGAYVGITLLVVGDLSFFYDSNALWNERLAGNLRIVLLNNGGGGIFRTLPGLDRSPARDEYIAGSNTAIAAGICDSYAVRHLSASSLEETRRQMRRLLDMKSERPVLLEVFLDTP